jgi:hypothetical protein
MVKRRANRGLWFHNTYPKGYSKNMSHIGSLLINPIQVLLQPFMVFNVTCVIVSLTLF